MDNFQLSVDNSRRTLQSTNSIPVDVHDLRANVRHLVGVGQARLNYEFQAREWSLCSRSHRIRYRGVQAAE